MRTIQRGSLEKASPARSDASVPYEEVRPALSPRLSWDHCGCTAKNDALLFCLCPASGFLLSRQHTIDAPKNFPLAATPSREFYFLQVKILKFVIVDIL
jgi:hypothetical protein